MIIGYNIEIENEAILQNLNRITNQIFKLLPMREEGGDWENTLESLILELGGMSKLIDQKDLFSLLCKMESMLDLKEKEDFLKFRKLVFESLNLMQRLKECLV